MNKNTETSHRRLGISTLMHLLVGGRLLTMCMCFCVSFLNTAAQTTHWRIEAESPQTRVLLRGDTLDITSPQGLSLWWDEPIQAPCTITYKACVVVEGGPCDRLSDLNCFWMASEPGEHGSPLRHIAQRGGRFAESYRLQCYYLGYGGNHNTTTRFRRYNGQPNPPLIKEYTDSAHLLRPNVWYRIRIEARYQHTSYYINDELLFDYQDPKSLTRGWFGFRTTWSHCMIRRFRADCNPAD